jgi:hypothetical protein
MRRPIAARARTRWSARTANACGPAVKGLRPMLPRTNASVSLASSSALPTASGGAFAEKYRLRHASRRQMHRVAELHDPLHMRELGASPSTHSGRSRRTALRIFVSLRPPRRGRDGGRKEPRLSEECKLDAGQACISSRTTRARSQRPAHTRWSVARVRCRRRFQTRQRR